MEAKRLAEIKEIHRMISRSMHSSWDGKEIIPCNCIECKIRDELIAEVDRLAILEHRFKKLEEFDIESMDTEEQCGFNEAWNIMTGEGEKD